MVGIVAVFAASSDLANSLSDLSARRLPLVRGRPFIHQSAASAFDDAESLGNFPHQMELRIRRDLCTGEINENGPVEIRSYRLSLPLVSSEHCQNLRHS
jgi:hypothetical protein